MRSILGACLLTASFAAHAWADGGPKKGSDADDAFMTGIRKLGVMSGEAFECSDVVDQPKIGQAVIDLATQVICISDCRLRSFIVARSAMEWGTTSITRAAGVEAALSAAVVASAGRIAVASIATTFIVTPRTRATATRLRTGM
jgi:hypothetical protein